MCCLLTRCCPKQNVAPVPPAVLPITSATQAPAPLTQTMDTFTQERTKSITPPPSYGSLYPAAKKPVKKSLEKIPEDLQEVKHLHSHTVTQNSVWHYVDAKKETVIVKKFYKYPSQINPRRAEFNTQTFEREKTAYEKLRGCSNIPQLRGCYEDEKFYYLVMEHIEGKELFMCLKQLWNKGIPEHHFRLYALQFLLTLQEIHAMKIYHRDLKPENLMMTEKGLVFIDFGYAAILDEKLTRRISFLGTPHFVAPEIIEGNSYDSKVDVFSAGCTLYEMLTGMGVLYDVIKEIPIQRKRCPKPNFSESYKRQAYDLITHMTHEKPKLRFTLEQALAHPFFKGIDVAKVKDGSLLAALNSSKLHEFLKEKEE